MVNKIDFIINQENLIQLTSDNKTDNFQKQKLISKLKKINTIQHHSKIINFILFEIILFLFPKQIKSASYIEIKVNKVGDNQIFSDDFSGALPSKILINGNPLMLKKKKIINIDSESNLNEPIHIEWENSLNNLSYMFSNLTSITYAFMSFYPPSAPSVCTMSHMFYNCSNLKNFTYIDSSNFKYTGKILDMSKMFYNCTSLLSATLNILNGNFFTINASYMFFDCYNLNFTNFISKNKVYIKVSDLAGMLMNCISLESLDIQKFVTNAYINISYMVYNCTKLSSFTPPVTVKTQDMSLMFYNCNSLINVDLSKFDSASYFLNMSNLFFNCYKLVEIGDFSKLKISDTSNMFYNCESLSNSKSLNFNPNNVNERINMTKMFYNCKNLEIVTFANANFYFYPNDLHSLFYNCISLTSVEFNNFKTDYVKEISYMMYNCQSLETFLLKNSNFSNSLITNMKGMFQNCKLLKSLHLSVFYTKNVEIMWDMFNGCESLSTLDLKTFDTSKVIDMESMFEGASNNFTLCIKENENIPNIFNEILILENIERDCSDVCYGPGKKRAYIQEKKLCCPVVEYNGSCYDKCPPKTKMTNEKIHCKYFTCSNYYNYEQSDCINVIPEGFYLNDSALKTIDKCHENCKTCIKGPTEIKENCLSCREDTELMYQFLGNCFNSCEYGNYIDNNGILKCRCVTQECSDCSEESLEQNLCISCAEGYYEKIDDNITSTEFKKCYKDPPKYYFNNETQKYHPCYSSCLQCYGPGDDQFHNCSICDSNHTFEILKNISGYESKNCFVNCTYYYYFDNDTYFCTKTEECPEPYNFIIEDLRQCVKSCNETLGYFKQFRKSCYKKCPLVISEERNDNPYLCRLICPFELPFELVIPQVCVKTCTIMDRSQKLCITNNFENRTNLELQEILYNAYSLFPLS